MNKSKMQEFLYDVVQDDENESLLLDSYAALLQRAEWKERRKVIIKKDQYHCAKCGKYSTATAWQQQVCGIELLGITAEGQKIFEPVFTSAKVSLHVHHKYYVLERSPWDYSDDDLITLCMDCHTSLHKDHRVPTYLTEVDYVKGTLSPFSPCEKCHGNGYLPEYDYHQNGKCFGCNGKCFVRIRTQLRRE